VAGEGMSLSDRPDPQDAVPIQLLWQELRNKKKTPLPRNMTSAPSFIPIKRKEIYPRSQEIRVSELEGGLLQRPSKSVLLTEKLLKGRVLENRHYRGLHRLLRKDPYKGISSANISVTLATQ
jgi:hypothetical protein